MGSLVDDRGGPYPLSEPRSIFEKMTSRSRNILQLLLVGALSSGFSIHAHRALAQDLEPLEIRAREGIGHAIAYLRSPAVILDPDAALLYSYIKDRFDLPELDSANSILNRISTDPSDQLYAFLRIARSRPCEMDFLDDQGVNAVPLAGLWYDQLEDRSELMERIQRTAWSWDEPYLVTHALWAMAMAKNCFKAELDTAIERRLVGLNIGIMEKNRPLWHDVTIEALAMAQYHDSTYVPPAEYIQEILDLQNPNGSWNLVARDTLKMSQHTTVLGLWALLQYHPLAWPVKPRAIAVQ